MIAMAHSKGPVYSGFFVKGSVALMRRVFTVSGGCVTIVVTAAAEMLLKRCNPMPSFINSKCFIVYFVWSSLYRHECKNFIKEEIDSQRMRNYAAGENNKKS